jgi:hypothetical protein
MIPKIDYLSENLTQQKLLSMRSGCICLLIIARTTGTIFNSVADPGCLSEFFPSRI